MEKIGTETRYPCTELFDAVVDREKLYCESVGRDAQGRWILHTSGTYNYGNAYSTSDEYFILTDEEYRQQVRRARENRLISRWAAGRYLRMADRTQGNGSGK